MNDNHWLVVAGLRWSDKPLICDIITSHQPLVCWPRALSSGTCMDLRSTAALPPSPSGPSITTTLALPPFRPIRIRRGRSWKSPPLHPWRWELWMTRWRRRSQTVRVRRRRWRRDSCPRGWDTNIDSNFIQQHHQNLSKWNSRQKATEVLLVTEYESKLHVKA